MSATFDIVAHHRRRTAEAERRRDALERHSAKLERLLALAVAPLSRRGKECSQSAVLQMLEALDDHAQRSAGDTAHLAQVLRETDPARRPPKTFTRRNGQLCPIRDEELA